MTLLDCSFSFFIEMNHLLLCIPPETPSVLHKFALGTLVLRLLFSQLGLVVCYLLRLHHLMQGEWRVVLVWKVVLGWSSQGHACPALSLVFCVVQYELSLQYENTLLLSLPKLVFVNKLKTLLLLCQYNKASRNIHNGPNSSNAKCQNPERHGQIL